MNAEHLQRALVTALAAGLLLAPAPSRAADESDALWQFETGG